MNHELPDVQAVLGKAEEIANICWIIKKAREFLKNVLWKPGLQNFEYYFASM